MKDLKPASINAGLQKIFEGLISITFEVQDKCAEALDTVNQLRGRIDLIKSPGRTALLIGKNSVKHGVKIAYHVTVMNSFIQEGDWYYAGLNIGKALDLLFKD